VVASRRKGNKVREIKSCVRVPDVGLPRFGWGPGLVLGLRRLPGTGSATMPLSSLVLFTRGVFSSPGDDPPFPSWGRKGPGLDIFGVM